MIDGKRILAVIPARSGSKGLVGKNTRIICGQPLIYWSVVNARSSQLIDTILVSTDDPSIRSIGLEFGAEAPFLRPDVLAADDTPTVAVIEHAIEFYKTQEKTLFDYVILVEPTSPLREEEDLDQIIKRLHENRAIFDSCISIGEVAEHPSIVRAIDGDCLKPFCPNLELKSRRQDLNPAYFPYGVGYAVKVEALLREKTFYCERTTFYRIKRHQCYEIDDIYDFITVENIMKYREKAV